MTQQNSILVVEDETSIASFVSAYLTNAATMSERGDCADGARPARKRDAVARHPRPEPPGRGRGRALPPDTQGLRRADPHAHGAGRGRRQDHRARGRGGRLHDEAVHPARARRTREECPPARCAERRKGETSELRHGDLSIDSGKREEYVGDEEIRLAPKEFELLWELLDHRGIVLTRDQLLERVWGYTFAGDTRTVDVHVRQIRRKLGDASPIVTVGGSATRSPPSACRHRRRRRLP